MIQLQSRYGKALINLLFICTKNLYCCKSKWIIYSQKCNLPFSTEKYGASQEITFVLWKAALNCLLKLVWKCNIPFLTVFWTLGVLFFNSMQSFVSSSKCFQNRAFIQHRWHSIKQFLSAQKVHGQASITIKILVLEGTKKDHGAYDSADFQSRRNRSLQREYLK